MQAVLFGLFSCVAVQLVYGAPVHTHDHAHHDDGYWNITLHILGGKDVNISWIFPPPAGGIAIEPQRKDWIIRALMSVGHGEHNNELKTGGSLRPTAVGDLAPGVSKNGYRGLTIEHLDHKGNSLHRWMMYCVHPSLEANLAVKTVGLKSKVTLEIKKNVVDTLLECPSAQQTLQTNSNTKSTNSGAVP